MISAHRLGKGNAPKNTIAAVDACLETADEVPFDFFEMDLQLTKDGEVVVYHSLFLDEVSDSEELFGVSNTPVFAKTYEELRRLNMGEKFENDGVYPYQGLRGDDIPEEIKISKIADLIDYIEKKAPVKTQVYCFTASVLLR